MWCLLIHWWAWNAQVGPVLTLLAAPCTVAVLHKVELHAGFGFPPTLPLSQSWPWIFLFGGHVFLYPTLCVDLGPVSFILTWSVYFVSYYGHESLNLVLGVHPEVSKGRAGIHFPLLAHWRVGWVGPDLACLKCFPACGWLGQFSCLCTLQGWL